MTEQDYINICDMCCRPKPSSQVTFCLICGFDYCCACKMAHDAQHEFVEEAIDFQ